MARKPPARSFADAPRHEGARFEGVQQGELDLEGAIVSGCEFVRCDLTEASFKGTQFTDCKFDGCELGLIDLEGAVLSNLTFDTCRLTGVRFELISQLPLLPEVRFSGCDLSFCSFRGLDLKLCAVIGSRLWESEFVGCDLTGVDFSGSDLARCSFNKNDLAGADLRSARNYIFSPVSNNVRGLRVALPEAVGLLYALAVELE